MNEREIAVLQQLHQRFSHVSAERVLSGPGLVNLYDALCALEGVVPEVLTPPDITRRAREGSCRICLEAVSMFCALLGTMAGNLVLTLGAVGGMLHRRRRRAAASAASSRARISATGSRTRVATPTTCRACRRT